MTTEPPIPLPLTISGARVRLFLAAFQRWADARPDIVGAAVTGSWARGVARPDSDLDIMVVANDIAGYLTWTGWLGELGKPATISREPNNPWPALRVFFGDGPEVDFSLTTPAWLEAIVPGSAPAWLSPASFQIVHDPEQLLAALLARLDTPPED